MEVRTPELAGTLRIKDAVSFLTYTINFDSYVDQYNTIRCILSTVILSTRTWRDFTWAKNSTSDN